MLKVKEAAKELDVSMSWLDKMIREDRIKVVWFGGVRRVSDEEMERIKVEGVDIRQE